MQAEDLGRAIRYHRERARLSRRELAALSGISETAIYDVEHGKATVQLQTLLALLGTLNLTLSLDGPLMNEFEKQYSHSPNRPGG